MSDKPDVNELYFFSNIFISDRVCFNFKIAGLLVSWGKFNIAFITDTVIFVTVTFFAANGNPAGGTGMYA